MQRRKFSREFKLEAVKLVRERGVSVSQAARDLGLDLRQSWMIGDQMRDVQAGFSAGVVPILLAVDGATPPPTMALPPAVPGGDDRSGNGPKPVPIEPARDIPQDHYTRNLLYDYDATVLKPCLEHVLGEQLAPLPSRADFVERLYGWNPYPALAHRLTLSELLALDAQCPPIPPYLEPD